ncbi:MAG: hypothetical protein Q7K42_01865, partial [Candidatus Diapherotrites archaeon]|nr:hypothetical protein [Candidatus Diapherotrites archaeon]
VADYDLFRLEITLGLKKLRSVKEIREAGLTFILHTGLNLVINARDYHDEVSQGFEHLGNVNQTRQAFFDFYKSFKQTPEYLSMLPEARLILDRIIKRGRFNWNDGKKFEDFWELYREQKKLFIKQAGLTQFKSS